MQRSTIFLSTAAVMVLSAGLVVGRLSTCLHVAARGADHNRGWFQDTLALAPDQRKSMDEIWADVKLQVDKLNDRRHGLDKDRDTAVRALMTPEQLVAYDKIYTDARAKRQEIDKEREALFHAANDRSRALLTPDQQVKWDAMQKDMHDHDHHGPGGPGGPGRMHNNEPSTQPPDTGAHGAGTAPS